MEINSKDMAQSLFEEIKLPYILKDESRPLRKEKISKIFFEEDADREEENEVDGFFGRIRKSQWLIVIYPIKSSERVEEVLKRSVGWVESSSAEYASARFEHNRIEIQSPVQVKWSPSNSEYDSDQAESEKKLNEMVQELEEKIAKKNQVVESYNCSFTIWLTDYLEKLKKTILKDQEEQKKRKKSFVSRSGTNFDNDDYGDAYQRTPNDDRSDSLNPNNSAYQAAQDNHANQLNPNNSRYQGGD